MGKITNIVAADVRQVVENGINNVNEKGAKEMENNFKETALAALYEMRMSTKPKKINFALGERAESAFLEEMIKNDKIACFADLQKEFDKLETAVSSVREILSNRAFEVKDYLKARINSDCDDFEKSCILHRLVWNPENSAYNTVLHGRFQTIRRFLEKLQVA